MPCLNNGGGAPSRRSHFDQKKKYIGHVDGVRNVPPNRVLPIDLGKSAIRMESAESLSSGASAVKISELAIFMCPEGRHCNGVAAMTPII